MNNFIKKNCRIIPISNGKIIVDYYDNCVMTTLNINHNTKKGTRFFVENHSTYVNLVLQDNIRRSFSVIRIQNNITENDQIKIEFSDNYIISGEIIINPIELEIPFKSIPIICS